MFRKQSQREFARAPQGALSKNQQRRPAAPRLPRPAGASGHAGPTATFFCARRRRMSCGTTTTAPAATHKLMATGL